MLFVGSGSSSATRYCHCHHLANCPLPIRWIFLPHDLNLRNSFVSQQAIEPTQSDYMECAVLVLYSHVWGKLCRTNTAFNSVMSKRRGKPKSRKIFNHFCAGLIFIADCMTFRKFTFFIYSRLNSSRTQKHPLVLFGTHSRRFRLQKYTLYWLTH